jgi:hypothetical protein
LLFLYFSLKDIPLYESMACGTKWHIQNEFRVLVPNTEVERPMCRWKENFNFDIEYEIALDMGLSWQGP